MDTRLCPFSLEGKTILVTGASSGIGRAVAVQCALMGAKVVLTGRNRHALGTTKDALDGTGHSCVQGDLTIEADRTALAEAVPQLDGVVNCAGIGQRKLCKSITAEDISQVMNINFNAAVLLQSDLLSAKKINKNASIVFISSRTADVPTIANSVYSASKGALRSYARCLAAELAPKGIRVNSICPAMVWTNLILGEGTSPEQLKEAEQRYPLKRYGQPEDVANLAVYLLSDAAAWMTGSSIDITGGAIEL